MVKVSIGVAYHKAQNFYPSKPYIPIQLGAALNKDLGIQKDNEGDNISLLNPYCCELTATYWLWKNVKSDYKGLFHYRRFLSFQRENFFHKIPRFVLYYFSKFASVIIRDSRYSLMTFPFFQIKETDIENTLNIFIRDLEADINVNSPDCYALGKIKHSTNTKGKGVERVMSYWHLNKASSIIHENYPEFSVWFDKALNASWFYACNIIIAKTEIFDDYCKTMFGILNKYHSFMNNGIKDGEINNAMFRDSGYLGEIITSAYIMMLENKGFCVKHLGLSQVDVSSDESQKGTSIKAFLKNIF